MESLSPALTEWRLCLASDRVDTNLEAQRRYGICTTGAKRNILGAIRPLDTAEIVNALKIARDYSVPIYPVSTGRNWGYGTSMPVVDGCVVMDLSGMNRIIELDRELGLVTLEPGVTQGELRSYLDQNAPELMVPTTGAGPNCSLMGNALERGYGITPYADHFGAVTALEAVLPNGELYRSALSELGGHIVDRTFKWGLGPYLDGLFAQGNFGIVTRMTIALAVRPQRVQAFVFDIREDIGLEPTVSTVQSALRALGGTLGSINLMNTRRMLAMTVPYPRDSVADGGILSSQAIADLARRQKVPAWTGVGALYGSHDIVRAGRKMIRRLFKPIANRVRFITPETSARLNRILTAAPLLRNSRVASRLATLDKALRIMAGSPTDVALPLAYWRSGNRPSAGLQDPARDGCGLIWYSPLVPMKPDAVRRYVGLVNQTCHAHGIEPLITITTLSDRCFDSSVPLLFDRGDTEQTARAVSCYDALFEAGKREGFLPYRLGINAMSRVTETGAPFWDLVRTIKLAVDPTQIIAPGRYAPTAETQPADRITGAAERGQ